MGNRMLQESKADQVKSNANRGEEKAGGRVIFRSEVLERYIQNESKTVMPRYVSPKHFNYLWALAGVFLITGLIVVAWPWIGPLLEN